MVATFIVILTGIAIALWYYLTFNALVAALMACDQSWSNVEVQLKRRFDLIDNLVAITKGYAGHEQETLVKTIQSRTQRENSASAEKANQVYPELNQQVLKLLAVAEAYPELKASEQFLNLQSELSNSENLIAERRHSYNQCVSFYKNLFLAFPSNLVAKVGSFKEKAFFDAPDEVYQTPRVSI